eukprot:TRINITY_DN14227_c1_g1_i2.p1 TRINITY_DN14227_c1_g1~~TRINITY_DN14227_c1_g1_i2.p1  ORF type:complete len:845 (+),score=91.09 TRINITY_DN14227_c1_g1_i2:162-2696(+)
MEALLRIPSSLFLLIAASICLLVLSDSDASLDRDIDRRLQATSTTKVPTTASSNNSSNSSNGSTEIKAEKQCELKTKVGSFAVATPMCQACASIPLFGDDKCLYDISGCNAVPPGGVCKITCRSPYVLVNQTTNGSCPAGNSIPARMLVWHKPQCGCPEPKVQAGYIKQHSGVWKCAEGYAGTPSIHCAPNPGCEGVRTWLEGCDSLVPCTAPNVDKCRYDVSACGSVPPGGQCVVRCKEPLLGGSTVATCPNSNTNPLQELDYFPLTCMLQTCPDPDPWPPGYNKTPDGKWTCADGYNGTAINRCVLGDDWALNCGAEAGLEGCLPIVPCQPPKLYGFERCSFDMGGCQSTDPGATCEVHCKTPFTGKETIATCPFGNTNPQGLIWERPKCILESCAEPSTIPAGYNRVGTTYSCAASFTGFATKLCEPTLSCEVKPTLVGCQQLVPCEAEQGDCRYNTYGCISVQPGSSCDVKCKAPFAGTVTKGICPAGNTKTNGLKWTAPTCVLDTCADPVVAPVGYKKIFGTKDWECAPGYSGKVVKKCEWVEAECKANPIYSGCVKESPCKLPKLPADAECMFHLAPCRNVASGSSCELKCKAPYVGKPGKLTCPPANTNENTTLQGEVPHCGCGEPLPVPFGYNRTDHTSKMTTEVRVEYSCMAGFVGKAEKLCKPGPKTSNGSCTVSPVMTGCGVPLPCTAAFHHNNKSAGGGRVAGEVHFGAALLEGTIYEKELIRYEVYFGDKCEDPIGEKPFGVAMVSKDSEGCCRGDLYNVKVPPMVPPARTTGFLIMAVTTTGRATMGHLIPLNTSALSQAALTAAARSQAMLATSVALAVTLSAVLGICA